MGYPLSRDDVWRRLLLQFGSLQDHARSQAREAALVSEAARQLLREVVPVAPPVSQALPLLTASEDCSAPPAASLEEVAKAEVVMGDVQAAREEAAWLKKVLEGVIGLANKSADGTPASGADVHSRHGCSGRNCAQRGPTAQRRQASPNSGWRSSVAASGPSGTEGCNTCSREANKRTVMRRLRRRDCRKRFAEGSERLANAADHDRVDTSAGAISATTRQAPQGTPATPRLEQLAERECHQKNSAVQAQTQQQAEAAAASIAAPRARPVTPAVAAPSAAWTVELSPQLPMHVKEAMVEAPSKGAEQTRELVVAYTEVAALTSEPLGHRPRVAVATRLMTMATYIDVDEARTPSEVCASTPSPWK